MNELERMNILRLSNAEANKITRDCMKAALVKLLNEKDLPQISVTEIVTAAGVSRPAFYRNYSSKEDLLEDVIASVKELLSKVIMLFKAAETPAEKKAWMTRVFIEAGKNSVELGWLINIGHPLLTDEQMDSIIGNEHPISAYMNTACISAIFSIIRRWIKGGKKEPPESMASLCCGIITGIREGQA